VKFIISLREDFLPHLDMSGYLRANPEAIRSLFDALNSRENSERRRPVRSCNPQARTVSTCE
jgi:hypothetical protein